METEEKTTMTETIQINCPNNESCIYNLKNFPKNNLKSLKKKYLNANDSNTYRNGNQEQKYKIFETQISPRKPKNLIIKKKVKIITRNNDDKKLSLLNEIKHLCHNIYDTNKNKNNNFREKLREDIIKSIDNYVFSDLKKNILFPKMLNIRAHSRINIQKIKFFSENKKNKNKRTDEKNKNIRRNKDSDKFSMKDILNKYDENDKLNKRNIKMYKFNYGDYAKNDTKYNHPQIHTLNNIYKPKQTLPKIYTQRTINNFHDFAKLIPEKNLNLNQKEKQLYKDFKAMKSKNKNEIGIHI